MSAGISRRDFVRSALAAGTTAALSPAFAQESSAAATEGDQALPVAIPEHAALVVNGLDPSPLRPEYLDMLQAGGVSCWHRSTSGIEDFSAMLAFCDRYQDRIAPARSVREIRLLHRQGRISHVSGWQSAEVLVQEGSSEKPAIGHLRTYHELGLRICGIAYNVANSFGGGSLQPDVSLTRDGRRLVEEIHKLRIVLDVGGHTGERASLDALAMSGGMPVVCTHTNIRAITDNPRCSSDELLEAIAKTGGVIGITAFNDFHARTRRDADVPRTPQVSLERHLDQYDYLKKLVGVDHIGLGPDFIEGRNTPGAVSPEFKRWMAPEAYSQQMPWFYVRGFENIGQLPNVTQGLRARGWTEADIRKLLGENWLRVYEQVWGA